MQYKSYLVEQDLKLVDKKLVLFYGENTGLKDEFKEKIKIKNSEAEILSFSQEEIIKNKDFFLSEVFNFSLFEKKKIFFIEQSTDKLLEILKEIESKIDNEKIYIFADILEKKSKLRNYFESSNNIAIIACYADNEMTIKKIILDKLKSFKGLSPQNINIIIDSCNLDRVKLRNEIVKIISYFENKEIRSDKLEILLNLKTNDDFNLLKEQAFNGNKAATNKLLSETIMDVEKNIFYLNTINQRLLKLAEAYKLSKNSNIEKTINLIKPPIFWKDKPNFIIQAKKWNLKKIRNILSKTYSLEIEIKSNARVSKNILMKKLIIEICVLANAW